MPESTRSRIGSSPDGGCYHVRRVRYTTGRTPVPAWVNANAVDPHLGRHVDGGPRVVAIDGDSGVIDAGDDADVLNDSDGQDTHADARPDECECDEFHTDTEVPCWPCFRDGFDAPVENDE